MFGRSAFVPTELDVGGANPVGVAVDGQRELKHCCLASAAGFHFAAIGQEVECWTCRNVLSAVPRAEQAWGPAPEFPTQQPRPLAKGFGIAMLSYERATWHDIAVEEDLRKRGLPRGAWQASSDTYRVAQRPLDWFERGSICVLTPTDVQGVSIFAGRLKAERCGTAPTDVEMSGVFGAAQ